jgi:hypothetical protein
MNANDPQDLESKMHRVLRGLPGRRAPSGLEARVLAEVARRAALPWWRKSFAHWPASVRATFFAVSGLAAAVLVVGAFSLSQSPGAHALSGGISSTFSWLVLARDIAFSARDRVTTLLASVPSVLLYGGGALVALGYAAVAALGAATFRALSTGRQTS